MAALSHFFKPAENLNFQKTRSHMPAFLNETVEYTPEQVVTYLHPSVVSEEPNFWIGRDELGLSATLIGKSNGLLVSDENTEFNENGKPEYTGPPPGYEEAVKA